MFGKPEMVGDAHDPAAGATGPPVTTAPDEDDEDVEDEGVDEPEELDEEPAREDEGAVGNSTLDLFENSQPASSTEAASERVRARIFLCMFVYTFVCAHTVLVCAAYVKPRKIREKPGGPTARCRKEAKALRRR